MRRAFLGIDCGTSSTKAVVVDESGEIVAVGRAGHPLTERPDGTREQDPAWWLAGVRAAVRQVVGAAPGAAIAGVGVSGQQHGLVALDVSDRPVRAAKLWNDTTTAEECRILTERLGGREAVLALTGNLFLAGYTAPKVLWLQRHQPEHYSAARRFCLPHDYIDLWLSGESWTEPGDASGTAYVDARTARYADPVLRAIDPERDWTASLPPIGPSVAVRGSVRQDAAAELGIPAGVPVSGGGGDNMCAAIGVGVVAEGPVAVSLGTSGTAFAHRDAPAVDPDGEAAAFCGSTGGWLPLACTLNCTGATDWVLELTGLDRDGFERALREVPAGSDGLTFVPYLDGERTPDLPNASAAFDGLRVAHGPSHLVRAVAEGVTFGLAYCFEALRRTGVRPTEVALAGGGARSDAWAQLLADVLGIPVRRPRAEEAAAVGAALQARWAVDGLAPPTPDRHGPCFEPHPSAALLEAADRHAELRALAVEGVL